MPSTKIIYMLLIRLHVGLEDADDLIADLDLAFTRFNANL